MLYANYVSDISYNNAVILYTNAISYNYGSKLFNNIYFHYLLHLQSYQNITPNILFRIWHSNLILIIYYFKILKYRQIYIYS